MAAQPCSVSEALAVAGHDPFLYRLTRDGSGPAWRDGSGPTRLGGEAVAVIRRDPEGIPRGLGVLGAPQRAGVLLADVAPTLPRGVGATVPRDTPAYLPRRLAFDVHADWDWRSTGSLPPLRDGEEHVRWLADDEAGAVKELLVEANPESSTWPGETKVRRWAGIHDQDGRLDACLADTSAGGQGHLSAISTRSGVRGHGLGSAITAWATRRLLEDGCGVVTLGVYAGNAAAQRTYDRLGFALDHRFTSGVLANGTRASEPPDAPADSGCH